MRADSNTRSRYCNGTWQGKVQRFARASSTLERFGDAALWLPGGKDALQ